MDLYDSGEGWKLIPLLPTISEDVEGECEKMEEPSSLERTSSMEMVTSGDEFCDAMSPVSSTGSAEGEMYLPHTPVSHLSKFKFMLLSCLLFVLCRRMIFFSSSN